MTISDGLKKLTTLASIEPTRRPASWSIATATGSPDDAARATSSAVTRPRWSSAVRSRGAPAVAGRRLAGPAERGAAGERLEAADVAAAADDRRVVDDLDVADVAGTALGAAMEAAVGDDPGADARPDLDDDDVVVAGGDAGPPLPEGEDVDVVVDPDRRAVARGEPLADRVAVPAGHDRRRDRPAGRELDRARHARSRSPTAAPGTPWVVASSWSNSSSTRPSPTSGPASISRRLVVMAEDPAVEGRDRDVDARRAEVRDEDVPGLGPERQLARRPAAGRRPDVALDRRARARSARRPAGRRSPGRARSARPARSATAIARAGSRRGPPRARRAPRRGSGPVMPG